MEVFHWGLAGAAVATGIGYAVPSAVGMIYFCVNRKQVLYMVRPKWRTHTIIDSCINGSSEMVSVLAFSVVAILFNRILMELGGSDGVASLSIIWYAQGLFGGLFRGYINGISPVVSYNLGRRDRERLSRLFHISVWTLGITALAVTAVSYLLGGMVVHFFAKGNAQVASIALHGFRIVATSFAMMAFNVFASGWFTALNDGKTSAILSFCRTIVFMVLPVLVLPRIWDMDGVWLSITAGEVLSLGMSIYYFHKFRALWKMPDQGPGQEPAQEQEKTYESISKNGTMRHNNEKPPADRGRLYLSFFFEFFELGHMKIAAIISLRQRLCAMQLSAFIPIIPLIHAAQTWDKLKAVFSLSEFANTAFGIGIIEFIDSFFITEFPVKLIRRCLTRDALLYLFILHLVREQSTFFILVHVDHERGVKDRLRHLIYKLRRNFVRRRFVQRKNKCGDI